MPLALPQPSIAQPGGLEGPAAAALCRRSHWVPKSSRSACSNCRRGFGLFAGKHHCRRCGEVVCKRCSTRRVLVRAAAARVCDDCVAASAQPAAALARRQSLPDARFRGRSSPHALLSAGRRSLPLAPELSASYSSNLSYSSGSSRGSDQLSAMARAPSSGKRRARKELPGAARGEWRSVVRWDGAPDHLASVALAVALAVLASLLAAAARK